MPRTILIVDDNALNRELLRGTLSGEYDVLEARDGQEALSLMHRKYKLLSAVLLDIMMPVMDGYEVLRQMQNNVALAQLPVIMVTGAEDEASRIKALSLGANDFISKPFNPEIIKHCLRNNIALRETASILNAIQKDKLTGLYNREAFFEKVAGLIRQRPAGYYILSCFDIDNFKLINDQYGAAEGDRILKETSQIIRADMDAIDGIAGRISADNFAALFPAKQREQNIIRRLQETGTVLLEQQVIVFSIGRYLINDNELPAAAIYDRAYIAKQSVKGRYDKHLAYFDEPMLERLVRDQQITSEMEAALDGRQFEVWFQPQYNHATGALIGAEALARWRHPQKGIVSPVDFIALFEQTGFVYELDKFVWREVCRYLRKWLDEGRNPLPVSVNISRYDIFRTDLIQVITGLVDEFNLPAELLRLEITESAFSSSTGLIVEIVKQLIRLGFTIEIDDFGSGYSSLNTLKDVPAQVVKLDMRFLEDEDGSQRGGNILQSIVRMTKWLGMTVLAEGVEEKEQADFLKSIGCTYVQGYLYAQPMNAREYEALCDGGGGQERPFSLDAISGLDYDSFWNPKSIDTLVFNSFAGCACVYEYHEGEIELIRVTDKYLHMVFGPDMTSDEALRIDWSRHINGETGHAFRQAMEQSIASKGEVSGEYLFYDLPGCAHEIVLRSTLRVIASTGNRHLLYCTSENITDQRQRAEALRGADSIEQLLPIVLTAMMASSNELSFVKDKNLNYICCSRAFAHMVGLSSEKDVVGKNDYDLFTTALADQYVEDDRRLIANGRSIVDMVEKIPGEDGKNHYSSTSKYLLYDAQGNIVGLYGAGRDITMQMEARVQQQFLVNSIPGGVATYEGNWRTLQNIQLTYFSDGFCQLFGYEREEYEKLVGKSLTSLVAREFLPELLAQIEALAKGNAALDYVFRAQRKDGSSCWLHIKALPGDRQGAHMTVNAVFFDVTAQQEAIERLRMSEEENRLAMQHSRTVVGRLDVAARRLTISTRVDSIYNIAPVMDNVPYGQVKAGLIAPETTAAYISFYESIFRGDSSGEVVFQRQALTGWRWLEAHFSSIFAADGRPASAVVSFQDVTESMEKDAAYKKWRQSLAHRLPDSYSFHRCNISQKTTTDNTAGALLQNRFPPGVYPYDSHMTRYAQRWVDAEDREGFLDLLRAEALLDSYRREKRVLSLDYRENKEEGGYRWLRLTVDLVEAPFSADVEAYLLFEDIDSAKRAELLTQKRAQTDPLTGVLNRATFAEQVNEVLKKGGPGHCHALLMLDVDGFKQVNDTFGHGVGDSTLIELSALLRTTLAPSDILGRLGGDEFMLFLPDIPGPQAAADKARQICALTRKTFPPQVRISSSIGIALAPQDGRDMDALYQKADETLYVVKESGRDNFAFYQAQSWQTDSGERKTDGQPPSPAQVG